MYLSENCSACGDDLQSLVIAQLQAHFVSSILCLPPA